MTIDTAILPFKISELTDLIKQHKGLGFEDALHYLYTSELYHNLHKEEQKLWYYTGYELYQLLEKEKKETRKNNDSKQTLFFVSFCIEKFSQHQGISAQSTLDLFANSNVIEFLKHNFEVLHTQSESYILTEINCYLKKRK
ncbi:MAG: DUF3791 domain-containing protein [Bacteroidales bacterium]